MNAPARPARSGVLAQVLTLLGGTLLAQVIAFVAQIGIARLYTDTDLGYLGIFTSAATLGAAVAGAASTSASSCPPPGTRPRPGPWPASLRAACWSPPHWPP